MSNDDNEQSRALRTLAVALAQRGATPDGIKWVLGALDPAHATDTVGVPSHDTVPTTGPAYTQEFTLTAPNDLPDGKQWSACIVTYGGDNTHCIWATGLTDANYSTDVGVLSQSTFLTTPVDVSTASLDKIAGSGPDPLGVNYAQGVRDVTMGRSARRSLTISYTGATLTDGGTLACAHFPASSGSSQLSLRSIAGIVGASHSTLLSYSEANFPVTNTQVYYGEAKQGLYLPQRVTTDPYAPVFIPSGLPVNIPGQGLYGAPPGPVGSLFLPYDPASGPNGEIPGWMTNLKPTCDSFIDNTAPTVTIIRGLDPSTTFQIKGVMGLELVPTPTSLERPYIRRPAVEDPVVIEAYARMQGALLAAWPSSYNFLGALAGILSTIGRAVMPVLMPVLRQAGISLVTSAADAATRRMIGGGGDAQAPLSQARVAAVRKKVAQLPKPQVAPLGAAVLKKKQPQKKPQKSVPKRAVVVRKRK